MGNFTMVCLALMAGLAFTVASSPAADDKADRAAQSTSNRAAKGVKLAQGKSAAARAITDDPITRALGTAPAKGIVLTAPLLNLDGDAGLRRPVPSVALTNKGSQLQIDSKAVGQQKEFQQAFAEKFLTQDPQPLSRKQHFTWIPYSQSLTQIGWYGAIVNTQTLADRSVEVTIKIQPWLLANSRCVISDFVHEKYLVTNGRFLLIDTDAANTANHAHSFPLELPSTPLMSPPFF